MAICVAPFSDEQWEALEALSAAARHIRMQPWRLRLQPGAPAQQQRRRRRQQQKQKEQQQQQQQQKQQQQQQEQPMRQLTRPACLPRAALPPGGRSPSGGALSLRGPERREPLPRGCPSVKRALWRGALWWLPNDARSLFGPPGAGKCMVVVVNGLLSNGRLPHAYYYKRPAL